MSDYITSLIRTVVPYLIGLVLAYLGTNGIHLSAEQIASLSATLALAIGTLYYLVVRALEHKWPKLGWLLGAPSTPTYGK